MKIFIKLTLYTCYYSHRPQRDDSEDYHLVSEGQTLRNCMTNVNDNKKKRRKINSGPGNSSKCLDA